MEGYLPMPVMRRADVTVHDALSFGAYLNRFKEDATLIFADRVARAFTGVIDYHEPGVDGLARWGRHRVSLPLRHTPSWMTWENANKKALGQVAFSQFLEDNIPDIAEPAGATIMEIARSFEVKKSVSFKSQIRADNGSHNFTFNEEVTGTSRGVVVPPTFVLGLRPFEGSTVYRIEARLRYRNDDGKLSLWFDLIRAQDVLDTAFQDELGTIVKTVGDKTPVVAGPAPGKQTAE
jgi:uncharacterized protein YfdQ (DUF2303 family)